MAVCEKWTNKEITRQIWSPERGYDLNDVRNHEYEWWYDKWNKNIVKRTKSDSEMSVKKWNGKME